jgi:hypothetical protein
MKWNKAVTMSFLRENPVTPKHFYIWPISELFKYLKEFDVGIFQTRPDPEWETFLWQQKKTAILVMLFGFLRPRELAQISAKKWTKVEKEGIFVEVEIKSHLGAKTQVFIPIIQDNSINPVYHMELLVANTENRMSKSKGDSLEFLFTDPRSRQR